MLPEACIISTVSQRRDPKPTQPREERSSAPDQVRTLPLSPSQPRALEAAFHLVFTNPPCELQYRTFPLTESPAVVGRDHTCHIHIERSDVSRRHAQLTRRGDAWLLNDLGSTNGTLFEGESITEKVVTPGTRFQLGHCELMLLHRDDPALERFQRYFDDQRHDELTDLPNHIALLEALGTGAHRNAALVLLAIDDFQRFNTEHGRAEGDVLLKEVAGKLRLRLPDEPLFRPRGARFVWLPRTPSGGLEDDVRLLLERVHRGLEATGSGLPVTLSAGVAVGDEIPGPDLMIVAERALARSQRMGGAQVWSESAVVPSVNDFLPDATGVSIDLRPIRPRYTRHSLRVFQELLHPADQLLAIEVADRQVIAMTNSRRFEKLERALDRSVRTVVLSAFADSKLETLVGEGLNGHPMFIAVERGSATSAAQLGASIAATFAYECRDAGIEASLLVGKTVQVVTATEAIAQATRALVAPGRQAHSMLPLPIGHALRTVSSARASEQRFFALTRLHQCITRWLFSVLAAELVRLGHDGVNDPDHRLENILTRPVTEGGWVSLTATYAKLLSDSQRERLVLPTYIDMLTSSRTPVLTELEQFVTARNRFAHGQDVNAPTLVEDWGPRIQSLLAGPLLALGDHPARYVARVDPIDDEVFDIHYKNLVGDNLALEPSIERGTTSIPAGRIVITNSGGQSLNLTPFALYLRCPTCHTEEVFCLDQLAPRPVFRSLREGAHIVKRLTETGMDARLEKPILNAVDRAMAVL